MEGPSNPTVPKEPFSFWREELKRAWRELRGAETTPRRAAVSVALGLLIGCLPIFGCHTPLVLLFCLWFQLDAATAWIASNISNPFMAPALLTAEVQLGAWLRTGAPLRLGDLEVTRAGAWHHFGLSLLVGAPVVGLMLAMAGALVTYGLVAFSPKPNAREAYRLPACAPPWLQAVERVAMRFASPRSPLPRDKAQFHYLRAKLLADPVAKMLAEILADRAPGSLLDIGTGRGQLPLVLLELHLASRAVGIDWDERKIASAQHAAGVQAFGEMDRLEARFVREDLRAARFEPADAVLLIDILHYFTEQEQLLMLARAADAVRPGGRILVREADTERGWRTWMTLAEERFFTWVRFNRGERVRFRPVRDIAAHLEAKGIRCAVYPAWGKTPFSNVLIVGEKDKAVD